jgi:hypothetical protein
MDVTEVLRYIDFHQNKITTKGSTQNGYSRGRNSNFIKGCTGREGFIGYGSDRVVDLYMDDAFVLNYPIAFKIVCSPAVKARASL